MPALNWDAFERLPGDVASNFEMLCRMLVFLHFGRYGVFGALAQQPGVEFHLKLDMPCSLGDRGRWYGWQCRWWDLGSGEKIGTARRTKIEDAIHTTERVLPDLTDWVLWTRRPLTPSDQTWFQQIETHMRLRQWTAVEAEGYLDGPATMLRGSYFGELVLTPEALADLIGAPLPRSSCSGSPKCTKLSRLSALYVACWAAPIRGMRWTYKRISSTLIPTQLPQICKA